MTAILAARAPGLPGRTSGAPITSSRTVRRRNTTLSTGVLGGWSGWSDMSDLSDASGWSRWSGVSGGSVHGTSRIPAFLDQAWGVSLDQKTLTETIPQQLFGLSIIPYAGFLYHLTKSKKAPKLTLFGFYFLLVFVFATIPAGIYAKKVRPLSLPTSRLRRTR